MESMPDPDDKARRSIRVSGVLGPLMLSSLRNTPVVRSEVVTTITVPIDADIVEVAQWIINCGAEIESIREITT